MVRIEDGEPGRVTSRKPNERKNQKSCPLGQMLPLGKEDGDRAIREKSLGPRIGRQISSSTGDGS